MLFRKEKGSPGLEWKWRLIGRFGKLFIDLIFCKSKVEVRGLSPIEGLFASRRCIFAFWHDRILLVSYLHKRRNAAILVSDSADGEIIAQILQRQGYFTVRGSTSKGGGRALARLIKEVRDNQRIGAVVPDGPQGPRHKVQPGVIMLAQRTGYPIVPVTYSTRRGKRFNSWDHFLLPYPGSDCMLVYGLPVEVPAGTDPSLLPVYSRKLEEELMRITRQADAHFGHYFEYT
jgi:lysophospholipid acyltransferase (LPLAT)-like uncharacterized protein